MCESPAVAADAERQHVRMLDQKQDVADASVPAFLRQGRFLERQRLGVGHEAEPPDFRARFSSHVSIARLMCAMN